MVSLLAAFEGIRAQRAWPRSRCGARSSTPAAPGAAGGARSSGACLRAPALVQNTRRRAVGAHLEHAREPQCAVIHQGGVPLQRGRREGRLPRRAQRAPLVIPGARGVGA